MEYLVNQNLIEHNRVAIDVTNQMQENICAACKIVADALANGNKILLFGNGGSAADAQHIAAEFTGRFVKERKALAAIALTTDTSALTAIGNDFGFETIFARQVEALANRDDVLIGISTSGKSPNVIKAFESGKKSGCKLIGFSGRDGGDMNEICDLNLIVPSAVTARIQEMHILIGHIMCDVIDNCIMQ